MRQVEDVGATAGRATASQEMGAIMSLSMESLLAHSERLPPAVRDALRVAQASPAESRHDMLELAACPGVVSFTS